MLKERIIQRGRIDLIYGCMFSGKTEELLKRSEAAKFDNLSVAYFKPALERRYHIDRIVSHSNKQHHAVAIKSSAELLNVSGTYDVFAIDEVQFFDSGLSAVCLDLAQKGVNLVLAGLNLDSFGTPFGPMPELMKIADTKTQLLARCEVCGQPAFYTQRISGTSDQFQLGGKDKYEPRCKTCYRPMISRPDGIR